METSLPKDPIEVLDYGADWTLWLAPTGDTIASSTWTVPEPLVKTTDSHTSTKTTVWLTNGVLNVVYALVNVITTAQGRTGKRTILVKMVPK